MLIELWERLRGYDKWIETKATLRSFNTIRKKLSKRYPILYSTSYSSNVLVWTDQHGEKHYGSFMAYETSPFFQMLAGETLSIRYDPSNPDRYYNRAYFLTWTVFWTKVTGGLAVFGAFIAWRVWVIITRRGF